MFIVNQRTNYIMFIQVECVEPTTGIEPVNLFLTKEALYRLSYVGLIFWSGRRGSNSRHSAWKAEALPTELLPLS